VQAKKGGIVMYIYETHCHTKESSACASLTPEQIVELYLANGYSGVFITDHFLNGNTTVNKKLNNATFQEKISVFCDGYRNVKKAANNQLQVFFGFEYSYLGTDVLVYGWDEQQLKNLECIMDMSMRDFCSFCKKNNALAVQAHPFREDFYIDHIRLFPNAEGVESFNSSRGELCNTLSEFYANAYKKISIGGSDCHHISQKILSGMAFDKKLTSEQDFINQLRNGHGKIIKKENVLVNP
jgi:hypothetical protein